MSQDLANRECVACTGGVSPVTAEQRAELLDMLNGWEVVDGHHLSKRYGFSNFVDALAFVNRVGEVAEANCHHPDLYLAWGKVDITIWTHAIDGLTESDFILAAKCDRVL
jgi:4a-hydroxytetrahydrobiopterin dehydratase